VGVRERESKGGERVKRLFPPAFYLKDLANADGYSLNSFYAVSKCKRSKAIIKEAFTNALTNKL
jgi:hypothetical protein